MIQTIVSAVAVEEAVDRPVRSNPDPSGRSQRRVQWARVLNPTADDALISALAEASTGGTEPAGRRVVSMHQPATELIALVDGDAMIGSVQPMPRGAAASSEGAETFLTERTVAGPGWLDAASAWRGGLHQHDILLVRESVVLRLPVDRALRIVEQHPAFAHTMLRVLAEHIDLLGQATRDLLHKDAEARFAVWLVQRLPEREDDGNTATLVLSERKRDIAAQLGVTPETLSRLQRGLVRKGVIDVMGYSVRVLDVAQLVRIAGA